MSTVRSTRARTAALVVALGLASCKRAPPSAPASASASPSAAAEPGSAAVASAPLASPPAAPRCRPLDGPGMRITLGPGAPTPAPGSDESDIDDDVALPFAPEIGVGAAFDGGFVVSALVPGKGSTGAILAVLSPGLPAGKTIELSKVHGDVSPPRVAASGKALIAAIPDGAPNGTLVRFVRVDDPLGTAHVTWGADVVQGSDDSEALALEVGSKTAVAAWDDWSAQHGVEVVRAVTFSPSDVTKVSPPVTLSSDQEDAEGPLLAPRAGGFWAAWMARAKRVAPAPGARQDEGNASASGSARAGASDPIEPVDTGPRWIVLAPLDEGGRPAGAAIRVTPKDGHVQGFDVAPAQDGGALVAFRDDATAPGTSGGTVRLVVVRADGGIDARSVSDEDIGPAVPSLLVDGAAVGALPGWLALTADSGEARLVALDAQGRGLDVLGPEPSAGTSTLLALRAGQLLVTRPRAKAVEAFVIACEKGPTPAAAEAHPF